MLLIQRLLCIYRQDVKACHEILGKIIESLKKIIYYKYMFILLTTLDFRVLHSS